MEGSKYNYEDKKSKMKIAQSDGSKYSIVNINPPHYDYKELKALVLPLRKDAIVWLWSSNRFLPSAFALIQFWGLQYRTMLTWVKTKRRKSGSQWLIDQTEHCLLATTGSPTLNLTNQSSVLIAASSNRHQKPPEFYHIIYSLNGGDQIDMYSIEAGESDEL
jgi:N6-adenosine-specific RNA methylase IME4